MSVPFQCPILHGCGDSSLLSDESSLPLSNKEGGPDGIVPPLKLLTTVWALNYTYLLLLTYTSSLVSWTLAEQPLPAVLASAYPFVMYASLASLSAQCSNCTTL